MGWWWNSLGGKTTESSISQGAREVIPETLPVPELPPVPESPKQPLTREQQAELELTELLKEFQAQAELDRETRIQSRQSGILAKERPIPTDISPDSLYPEEMSCRSALDYALFCQSFGGQFVNIYRYGGFRSCSNHWDDFWLCMRTRQWEDKEKRKAIKDHYRKKAVKWKTGPSSEDIWEVREEPVKDAFQDSLEELEEKIAQWKQANPGVADPWHQSSSATFKKSA